MKPQKGVRAESQGDELRLIDRYDTDKKSDIRKRAICLVNLITANRPSEMVRLKVSDFDLENRSVNVMMVKQGEMKEKRLTLECVQAVKNYIVVCELHRNDYFVGAADKWGNHTSRQIHEDSYAQSIHNWLGFAPYTFRKTQIGMGLKIASFSLEKRVSVISKKDGILAHHSWQTKS